MLPGINSIAFALLLATTSHPFSAQLNEPQCRALAGLAIPAEDISLATGGATAASATVVKDVDGELVCKVLGSISPVDQASPQIQFQVNLPFNWNGKALQIGGGRANGYLVTAETAIFADPAMPTPIQQGYATFGSDSGHQTGPDQDQVAFGLDREARQNFAGDQLAKTYDVAMGIIRRAFGVSPRRVYFQGASQGGGEAFKVLQRWPEKYDGVIAIHPLYNFTPVHLSGVLLGQLLHSSPEAWISPEQGDAITKTVVTACDRLDGLDDGIVGNVSACRRTFDPEILRCRSGDNADPHCLSDKQMSVLNRLAGDIHIGVRLAGGIDSYGRWPVFEGGMLNGFFNPFGRIPSPRQPPKSGDSYPYFAGDGVIRYMLMEDADYNSLRFKPVEHEEELKALSRQMDASSTDISAFRDRGGKLLILHGSIDMAVPPHNTIAYWDRLKCAYGSGLADFARFYLAPGLGHNEGPFRPGWNSLGALDAWVEQGLAPDLQIVVDTNEATQGRTRPLCEYPAYPRYLGTGDPNSAANFRCEASATE